MFLTSPVQSSARSRGVFLAKKHGRGCLDKGKPEIIPSAGLYSRCCVTPLDTSINVCVRASAADGHFHKHKKHTVICYFFGTLVVLN